MQAGRQRPGKIVKQKAESGRDRETGGQSPGEIVKQKAESGRDRETGRQRPRDHETKRRSPRQIKKRMAGMEKGAAHLFI